MYSFMNGEFPEILDWTDDYYSYQYYPPYYQAAGYHPAGYAGYAMEAPGYPSGMCMPDTSWMYLSSRCNPQDICAPLYGWWPGG